VVQINDTSNRSISTALGGQFGGTMTNMDALTIPAAGGIDSTALIIGDFSMVTTYRTQGENKTLSDLKGQNVNGRGCRFPLPAGGLEGRP
jgi:NitT/TauT family transport system substrate-binding protein